MPPHMTPPGGAMEHQQRHMFHPPQVITIHILTPLSSFLRAIPFEKLMEMGLNFQRIRFHIYWLNIVQS